MAFRQIQYPREEAEGAISESLKRRIIRGISLDCLQKREARNEAVAYQHSVSGEAIGQSEISTDSTDGFSFRNNHIRMPRYWQKMAVGPVIVLLILDVSTFGQM